MPEINIGVNVTTNNLSALQQLTTLLQQASSATTALTQSSINKNQAMGLQTKATTTHNQAQTQTNKSITQASKATKGFSDDITHNIAKVAEWTIATMAVFNALRLLKTGVSDVIAVEYAMAGLTKVMRNGQEMAKNLRMPLMELGVTYGELGTEVINASTEWARLGLTQKQIAQNATVALLGQAVAEMEVTEATKYLVSAQQQFHRSVNDNIEILDSWNQLSNTYAVRTIDLAQATQRAGAAIYATGGNIQELNAYTTALVQSTGRSGNEIGNAIKTLVQYSTRVETVNQLLKDNVVQVQDVGDNLKPFGDILSDIASQWAGMDDVTKRNVATTMAGTRQANIFINLMEQYPTVLKAQADSWRSVGSSMREAQIYLNTTKKQLDSLRSAFMMMASSMSGAILPLFKTFITATTNMLLAFAKFPPLLLAIGAGLIAMAVAFQKATVGVIGFNAAIKAAALNPYMFAVTALTALVIGLANAYGEVERRKKRALEIEKLKGDEAHAEFMASGVDLDIIRQDLNTYENLLKKKDQLDEKGREQLEEARKTIGKFVGNENFGKPELLGAPPPIKSQVGDYTFDIQLPGEKEKNLLGEVQMARNKLATAEMKHITQAKSKIESNKASIEALEEERDALVKLYESELDFVHYDEKVAKKREEKIKEYNAQIQSLKQQNDDLSRQRKEMLDVPLEGDMLDAYLQGLSGRLDDITEKYRYLGAMRVISTNPKGFERTRVLVTG